MHVIATAIGADKPPKARHWHVFRREIGALIVDSVKYRIFGGAPVLLHPRERVGQGGARRLRRVTDGVLARGSDPTRLAALGTLPAFREEG